MKRVHKIKVTESLLKLHFVQIYSMSKEFKYSAIDEEGINEKYPGFLETFDFEQVEMQVLFEFVNYRRKWGNEQKYFDLLPTYFYYIWDKDNTYNGNTNAKEELDWMQMQLDWLKDTKRPHWKNIFLFPKNLLLFTDYKIQQNNDLIAVDYYNVILLLDNEGSLLYYWNKSNHECDTKITFLNDEYIAIETTYFEKHRGDETIFLKYNYEEIERCFNGIDSIELVELIIKNGVRLAFFNLSDELKSDKNIILKLLKHNWFEICDLSDLNEAILSDKEFILEILNLHYGLIYFEYASENLKNDPGFMIEVVKKFGSALKYASKELQEDKNVVLEAVKQDGVALEFASKALQEDKEVVLEAVKRSGVALEFASKALQEDKEVVLDAVKQYGGALEYASKDLQGNKEVVLEAVKQDGNSLRYASKALQEDKEVVLEAVKQTGKLKFFNNAFNRSAFMYCSKILSNDIEFIIESSKLDLKTMELVNSDLISKHKELQDLFNKYKLKCEEKCDDYDLPF